jgi:exopolyphosphatase/guanosine-5'-triphosphate,3'-diphosphate pyrophosphatase
VKDDHVADRTIDATATPTPTSPKAGTGLRWEWRAFGQRFGDAESRFAALTSSGTQESDETYFLTGGGDNVKVRDALMDVKVLREVNADGLEQWAPVMKAAFPLTAADAARVFEALREPLPAALPDELGLGELTAALAHPDVRVRVVEVHKRRVRYTVEGCTGELSDIAANGLPVRTIAVESEDPQAVMRAVEALGLTGYVNTSYPRGLADLLDGAPERYAVIDAGTNSIKFHIAERNPDATWTTVADRAEVTRLGEGLAETGRISEAALERTAEAIAEMAAEAKRSGVRATAAVGTAGLRIAANSAEVIAAIRERSGVRIETVSGDEEARLAYLATTAALGPVAGATLVFDTGGGSSQFTFGHGGSVDERFSVDVGAARFTERFGLDRAVSEGQLSEAMAAIAAGLERLDGRPSPDTLVGMGGAVTNLTAVSLAMAEYDPARIQGAVLTDEEIDRQIALYRERDADARRAIVGLQPKRAEVILAGACIVRTVLDKLGKRSLTVSDRGLRHGLLVERFGG